MKNVLLILGFGAAVFALSGFASGQVTSGSPDDKQLSPKQEEAAELKACVQHLAGGFLKIPDTDGSIRATRHDHRRAVGELRHPE